MWNWIYFRNTLATTNGKAKTAKPTKKKLPRRQTSHNRQVTDTSLSTFATDEATLHSCFICQKELSTRASEQQRKLYNGNGITHTLDIFERCQHATTTMACRPAANDGFGDEDDRGTIHGMQASIVYSTDFRFLIVAFSHFTFILLPFDGKHFVSCNATSAPSRQAAPTGMWLEWRNLGNGMPERCRINLEFIPFESEVVAAGKV